jgi:hypothetical protein
MKTIHMLKYIISSLMILLGVTLNYAQENTEKDTVNKIKNRYGLRVGLDLHRASKAFYDSNYKGLELVADYRITPSHYIAGEMGNENKTPSDQHLNFTTKGSYVKVGFDYNAYENWLDMENMIYVGLRYGISTFSQTLNTYQVYDRAVYFPEQTINANQKYDGLNAQWIEFVTGVKAKLFNNLFLGFSLRVNRLVNQKKPNNFDNLYIPGFNRTYDGNFGVGFNYTLSYLIPIYKK